METHFRSLNYLDSKYNWLLKYPVPKVMSGHIFKSIKSHEFGKILKFMTARWRFCFICDVNFSIEFIFLSIFHEKMQVSKTSIIWGENLDLYGFYVEKGLLKCISFANLILVFLWKGSYLWTTCCLSCVSRPLKLLTGITVCRNPKTEGSSCFSYMTDFSFFMAEKFESFQLASRCCPRAASIFISP